MGAVKDYIALEIRPVATPEEKKAHIVPGNLRESLESFERQGGGRDPRLDSAKPPAGFEYLWDLFFEIRGGGSEGMGGIRLTWHDLADYQAVTGMKLDAFEVEALMAMDAGLRAAIEEKRE